MKRFSILALMVCFVLFSGLSASAQGKIDPSFQIKNTTLAVDESVVGASSSQTLTNKTIDDDDNTITDLAISALKTVIGNANMTLIFDATGAAIASSTLPDAMTVSGSSIDRGTVADARVASTLARDSEVSQAITDHAAQATSTHGLPAAIVNSSYLRTSAGGVMEWGSLPSAGSRKRAEATLGVATSTVTFGNDVEGNPLAIGTFGKCIVYINGIASKYSDFTKTSANVIETSFGDLPLGTVVMIDQVD